MSRTRGSGSVMKKPGTQFWYIAYYDCNHKQIQESSKSTLKSVAEELLRQRLLEVGNGVQVDKARNLKYEDVKQFLVSDYKNNRVGLLFRSKSKDDYVYGFQHLEYFSGRLVKNITSDVLDRFVEKRRCENASAATINRNLALLRRMMNLAKERGMIQSLPYFPMQKEVFKNNPTAKNNVRTGWVDQAEFDKILKLMPENLHPLLVFLYETGCRVGAALQIKWEMVSADATKIELPGSITKSEAPLMLALTEPLTKLLKTKFRRSGAPVFDSSNLRKEWDTATTAVGKPELLIHDLRRSAIRNLRQAGVDETVIMKISGHKTNSVFKRYNIISDADIKDASQKLEAYRSKKVKAS